MFAHLRILRRVVVRYVTVPLHLQRVCSEFPPKVVGLDCSETAACAPLQRFFRHLINHLRLSALAAPHQEPRSSFIYYANTAIIWMPNSQSAEAILVELERLLPVTICLSQYTSG